MTKEEAIQMFSDPKDRLELYLMAVEYMRKRKPDQLSYLCFVLYFIDHPIMKELRLRHMMDFRRRGNGYQSFFADRRGRDCSFIYIGDLLPEIRRPEGPGLGLFDTAWFPGNDHASRIQLLEKAIEEVDGKISKA